MPAELLQIGAAINAGTFPEASFGKTLRVRFMKAFLGFIRPLV